MVELNKNQKKAVEHDTGPALVVAGAGTGKTSVIVERIIRLIERGVNKQSILALTFTEKAAQEMLDRVSDRLENSYGAELNIFTFNAFGSELLREFAIEIGLSPDLSLLGETGKTVLLREHLDELELDYFAPVSAPDRQLRNIADYISLLKQQLVKPSHYTEFANKLPGTSEEEQLERKRHLELAHAFERYLQLTRSQNRIDYDDQIYALVELLESRPNVRKKLQERYAYILVDEFQDTNPMQSRLLDLLTDDKQNLMVVGDDDQSIYGWRGATLANILDFTERYQDAAEITLIDNYRSTQTVLDSAYALIQNNNPDRLEAKNGLNKQLVSHRGKGQLPLFRSFPTLDLELDWVARDIKAKLDSGVEPGQIAVLSRRGGGVVRMHQALELHDIEHSVVGVSSDLYDQPIVASMVEALKAVVDASDTSAIYHTLSGPLFEVSPELLARISTAARKQHQTFQHAAKGNDDATLRDGLELLSTWQGMVHEKTIGQLAFQIIDETGLKDSLVKHAEESEVHARSAQALFQWFASLREFEKVSNVPSAISYLENLPTLQAEGETLSDDTTLIAGDLPVVMTVHKSKGLEWDHVYIIDCTERSFPLQKRSSSLSVPDELSTKAAADDHYNEERRLMYVATTRAREHLALTASESHNGTTKRKLSRFIIEMFGEEPAHTSSSAEQQMSFDLFNPQSNAKQPQLNLPSRMRNGDLLVLTASEANDYLRCPLDFKYRHILGVPAEPSPHATVGTRIHGYLQRINVAKMDDTEPPKLAELSKDLKENWPQEGYLSAEQRSRALEQALAALEPMYEAVLDAPTPVATEEPFRVQIPNSSLILRGRIDVVLPVDGGVEIRDYKTSTSATTPEKAKSSTQSSKQLEMYAIAWRLKHGDAPKTVSLDFVQTSQIGTVKKQSKTLDKREGELAEMAEKILAGEFAPGYSHDFCRHPKIDA